jgi:hypothetical protein
MYSRCLERVFSSAIVISASTVLECSCCRIYRYVAAPEEPDSETRSFLNCSSGTLGSRRAAFRWARKGALPPSLFSRNRPSFTRSPLYALYTDKVHSILSTIRPVHSTQYKPVWIRIHIRIRIIWYPGSASNKNPYPDL